MKEISRWLWLGMGVFVGILVARTCIDSPRLAAAGNDRYEDYILCTGPVAILPNSQTDGVWLLDYRAGRLLGSVIDRNVGKIVSWAEVDLVGEFGIQPRQNVHFMMTTGSITNGQAALYVAETTTGRFGIYTMGPRPDGRAGVAIRRHDLTVFRQPQPAS
ncbi:MAG: hypothetical protein L0Y72_15000 [Gemmataceae bacterium]|nr:hypothetical protein [Gemmataceae bacterium]MCI0740351.1 hypothetical protein [Gemmataceae bacterium]